MSDLSIFDALQSLLVAESFGARVTVVTGAGTGDSAVLDQDGRLVAGSLPAHIGQEVAADARILIDRERPATVSYDDTDVFVEPVVPKQHLVIFGAVHIAQELAHHGRLLGYRITVSDARPAFTTTERFPAADELLVGWPDEVADRLELDRRTSVVVLSHDARFEDPLWPIVLPTPVRYIGAMGSRRTAGARRERLLTAGFDEETVSRIHGPIGLDIGSESPGEVAIAILGEMIATRRRPEDAVVLNGEIKPLARSASTN